MNTKNRTHSNINADQRTTRTRWIERFETCTTPQEAAAVFLELFEALATTRGVLGDSWNLLAERWLPLLQQSKTLESTKGAFCELLREFLNAREPEPQEAAAA